MISAIVLAAGESKRMGKTKQLLLYRGKTLVERAVDTVLASEVDETIVVVGHRAEVIREVLKDRPVKIVFNERYRDGMSTSLKAGVENVSLGAEAVLVMLGDQPDLMPEVINRLISSFGEGKGGIVVPVHQGRRGNPVLFATKYKSELTKLIGDVGARQLLAAHPEDVHEVEVGSEGIFLDVDSPEDFKRYGSDRGIIS